MTPSPNSDADTLKVGLAQIAPVWLNRDQTLAKTDTGCGSSPFPLLPWGA